MPVRGAKKKEIPTWYVGFVGDQKIDSENAKALLDNALPEDIDLEVRFPDTIKRGSGLRTTQAVLDDLNISWKIDTLKDTIQHVQQNNGVLIVLGAESLEGDLLDWVTEAIQGGTKALDLCDALDEITVDDDEPAADEPKTYGQPRGDATIVTDGPATIAVSALTPAPASDLGAQLEDIIRTIVIQEIGNVVYPGTHSNVQLSTNEQEARIVAWVTDADGDSPTYERAKIKEDGKPQRAPRGKKTVELTPDEAAEVGLA